MHRRQHDTHGETGTGPARWSAAVEAHRTILELRREGRTSSRWEAPSGSSALGPAPDAAALVELTNQVHRWLDGHVVVVGCGAEGPLVVRGAVPAALGSRWRRGATAPDLRATAERLRCDGGSPAAVGTAVILDTILERLELDGLVYASRSRTRDGAGSFRRARRSLSVAAVVVVTLATSVVAATQALLSDQVAMAAVTAEGGTLDIQVDSSTTAAQDGPNANWGTFSASLTNMRPGDTRWADITLHNPGSLPATVTVSSTGADTHADDPVAANHCFAFFFRERAAGADVLSIEDAGTTWGTAETNAGVRLFETAIPASGGQLFDDGALRTDDVWEVADTRVYRLTVRMLDGCRQGSGNIGGTTFANPVEATGTLSFTFDATQTAGGPT